MASKIHWTKQRNWQHQIFAQQHRWNKTLKLHKNFVRFSGRCITSLNLGHFNDLFGVAFDHQISWSPCICTSSTPLWAVIVHKSCYCPFVTEARLSAVTCCVICCNDLLHWPVAMTCCNGLLQWPAAMTCCSDLLQWPAAMTCCIGLVQWNA